MVSATATAALISLLLAQHAVAQDTYVPPKLRLTPDVNCVGGELLAIDELCAWGTNTAYSTSDLPTLPSNDQGQIEAFISGQDIYTPRCEILIYEKQDNDPTAGQLVASVSESTQCRKYTFPQNFALSCCCGQDQCEIRKEAGGIKRSVIPRELTRSHARQMAPTAPSPVAAPLLELGETISQEKVKPPQQQKGKRQGSCNWVANGGTSDVDDRPQVLTGTLTCPGGVSQCTIENSYSVSYSQTNTFGVSAEVGVSFFEIVQASISFSYEYSFTEEETREQSYTVTLSPGQSGYLTWTPKLECTWGHFEGDCDWDTMNGDQGRACVPKYLSNNPDGVLAGSYNLVQELRVAGEPPAAVDAA